MESTVLDAFCATTSLGFAISEICFYKRKSRKLQVLPQQEVVLCENISPSSNSTLNLTVFQSNLSASMSLCIKLSILTQKLTSTHPVARQLQQVQVLTNAAAESIFTRFCWLQPFAVRLRTCTLDFALPSPLEGCWLTSVFHPDDEGKCVCTHSSAAAAVVEARERERIFMQVNP